MKVLFRAIFFGNYFYGVCAVALSVETSWQLFLSFHSISFYLFLFSGTVIYYTYAYLAEPAALPVNTRSLWYQENREIIHITQWVLFLVFISAFGYFVFSNQLHIVEIRKIQWFLLFIFPFIAILYYTSLSFQFGTKNLRSYGWIKPIVIGFVWAGMVTIYPTLFNSIEKNIAYKLSTKNILFFINNLMFISLLCIMFDIKDYATDYNQQLKTFVVRNGLRKTLFRIIIPLSSVGLSVFMLYAIDQHFSLFQIVINIFPFIMLIIVAYSLHQRKSILYYLAIIDGLMLIKAFCGIIGITLIK